MGCEQKLSRCGEKENKEKKRRENRKEKKKRVRRSKKKNGDQGRAVGMGCTGLARQS